jgi:hypothetical protein
LVAKRDDAKAAPKSKDKDTDKAPKDKHGAARGRRISKVKSKNHHHEPPPLTPTDLKNVQELKKGVLKSISMTLTELLDPARYRYKAGNNCIILYYIIYNYKAVVFIFILCCVVLCCVEFTHHGSQKKCTTAKTSLCAK